MKIAIIGAGLTGLVAGYRLQKKGHQVNIFEKTDEIGGLAGCFKINSAYLEKNYHHIFKTDTFAIDLIKELGLEDKLTWQKSSVSIYYNDEFVPFRTPVDLLKFKHLNMIDKLRLGLSTLYLQKTKNWKKFEGVTAHDWLIKHCGKKAYEIIWQPLLKGKFHDLYQEISMVWFWARIHIRANSKEKGGEKLGYLYGSLKNMTDKLSSSLDIHLNSDILNIKSAPKGLNITLTSGETKTFDKVICTTASNILAELIKDNQDIGDDYLKKLKSVQYLGALCFIFSSKKSLSKYYWNNINTSDSPFLAFIQHTNFIDQANYSDNHIYYLGVYLPHGHEYFQKNKEQIAEIFLDHLKKIIPDFKKEDVINSFLFKFKNSQHVVDRDYRAKIPNYQTPLPGLFLVNFSQLYPEERGINFSIREGTKISEKL